MTSGFVNESPLPVPKTIRFVNSTNQPPSKRRRIRAACLTCRKRKTRCGGEHPICKTCLKFNHTCLGYPEKRDPEDDGKDEVEDEEEEDERRHYKSKNEAKRRSSREGSGTDLSVIKTESDWEQRALDQAQARRQSKLQSRWQGGTILQSSNASMMDELSPISTRSPLHHHSDRHRVPYFRYFGPTAIVPGFKQMVVSVRDRKRSSANVFGVATSPGSGSGHCESLNDSDGLSMDDMPIYDPTDLAPVPPLIMSLVKTFFSHLGCNYPFLREAEFTRMVKEKRVEPILVDAVCAIAARFSDEPIFSKGKNHLPRPPNSATSQSELDRPPRADNGAVYAQRAKAATVDTFPCPSVGAVQACLLMAYEGFGADQDSALWMYLGCAIRMAVDLGLQKNVGVRYQGEKDPWYTRNRGHTPGEQGPGAKHEGDDLAPQISLEEQKSLEQERRDTFWAVFVLDRVISSGTGRPVTFRDDDFELTLPETTVDPVTGLADPLPMFIQTIHLYGRASDVFNNIRDASDLTREKLHILRMIERDLTALHHRQHPSLNFNPTNFTAYYQAGRGTTFVLMHVWFHALIIILHQPTLVTPVAAEENQQPGSTKKPHPQLSQNSVELAMSSARTIADILAFTYIFETPSFLGNPFTSQPMYIAACACLRYKTTQQEQELNETREGSTSDMGHGLNDPSTVPGAPGTLASPHILIQANTLKAPAVIRSSSQDAHIKSSSSSSSGSGPAKHSILAATYEKNYMWCYNSLKRLHTYWGGVKYILTALDQKAKGIWDCETYTREEYEAATMSLRRGSKDPPIAMTVAGTLDSPSSSLTVIHQNSQLHSSPQSIRSAPPHSSAPQLLRPGSHHMGFPPQPPQPPQPPPQMASPVPATPPGNMIYDPIRQSLPDPPPPPLPNMYTHVYAGAYPQPTTSALRHSPHTPRPPTASSIGSSPSVSSSMQATAGKVMYSMAQARSMEEEEAMHGILGAMSHSQQQQAQQNVFTPTSQHSSTAYESIMANTSPVSNGTVTPGNYGFTTVSGGNPGVVVMSTGTGPGAGPDRLTFDSRDIDINQLHNEMVMIPGWEAYYSDELLGFFGSGGM